MSVIVPAHNEAARLGRQLDALAQQAAGESWEVIVADNGSTDSTVAVAHLWSDKLDLRVVDASLRLGPGAARNIAVEHASGELLLFCDADDEVAPGWVEAHVRALAHADLVAGAIVHVVPGTSSPPVVPSEAPRLLAWMPFAQTANCSIRKSAFDAVGGFPESLVTGEDVALSWRLQLDGHQLVYEPAAIVYKRQRDSAGAVLRQYFRYGIGDVELYRRYRTEGVPRAKLRGAARSYLGLVARLPRITHPNVRQQWLHQLGRRAGRLAGSARTLTWYP